MIGRASFGRLFLIRYFCCMRRIAKARPEDIPQLLKLVNSAYRGEEAKKGWTHEADLIDGTVRIDERSLYEMILKNGAVILKCTDEDSLVGSVYLEKQGEELYLGMLSVLPHLQGSGIGKELLMAADTHAREVGCRTITMNVISVREELIEWYSKYGYRKTDLRKPFPDDARFGKPTQPLEFAVLKKEIQPLDTIL